MFERQAGENAGAYSKDNLKSFALALGLDPAAFADCLDSGKYAARVQQDTASAQSLGVRSTPTFLINGRPLVGLQSIETFQQYIDAAMQD